LRGATLPPRPRPVDFPGQSADSMGMRTAGRRLAAPGRSTTVAAAPSPGPGGRRPGGSSRCPTRRGGSPVAKTATIRVPSLKVTVPLAVEALPGDLVPVDGPAGEPTLDLVLEGGSLTVRAK